jgi:hypothetical protein
MSRSYQRHKTLHVVRPVKRSARTHVRPMKQANSKQSNRHQRVDVIYSTWRIPLLAHEDRDTLIIGNDSLNWTRGLAVALACDEPFHDLKPIKRGAARVLIATTRPNVAEELAAISVREAWLPRIRIAVQFISFFDAELIEHAALGRAVKACDPEFVIAELPESLDGNSLSSALNQIRAALGDLNAPILCPVNQVRTSENQITFRVTE